MAVVVTAAVGAAHADPARLVSFIEVRAAQADTAAASLARYAHAVGEGVKPSRIEALRELGRPERFTLVEAASDPDELTAAETRSQALLEALTPALTAPLDRRSHREFGAAAAASDALPDRHSLYVVAHLDIGGPVRPVAEEVLTRLAAAARGSAGNLRFEVWQQRDRANHFNVVAVWRDRASFDAFVASAAAREFRASVAALIGSPYDERLYRRID